MPSTPKGFPYPAPTDPVASGAANFQSLATAIDTYLVAPAAREMAYAERTTDLLVSVTTQGTALVVVNTAAVTYDGATPVLLEFSAPKVEMIAGNRVFFGLTENGTLTRYVGLDLGPSGVAGLTIGLPMFFRLRFTPAAGSKSYAIVTWATAANQANLRCNVGAGELPASLRIQRAL